MDGNFREIIYAKQDGVGLITLNRPHVLNAFSYLMGSSKVKHRNTGTIIWRR